MEATIKQAVEQAAHQAANRSHLYYPPGVVIPGYVANTLTTTEILAIFSSTCAVILGTSLLLIRRARPSLAAHEVATALWFVLCGFIHLGLEGYFAFNFHHMGSRDAVLGQLWKEYSLSDSRYLTQDAFVTSMEFVTAVCWGPLSFVTAVAIVADLPFRHVLQSFISLGQIYGNILYYMTATYGHVVYGQDYSRPEMYYFIGYYVFLNAIWIVIPGVLLFSSARAITRAFASQKASQRPSENGAARVKSKAR